MPTDATIEATTDVAADAGSGRRRAALIINPIKATTVDVESAVRRISAEDGWEEPLVIETTADDPGHGQAREALAAGVDLVIAAGGDGTVRCVAEELAGSGTMMALVPLGTGGRGAGLSGVVAARSHLQLSADELDSEPATVDEVVLVRVDERDYFR